MEALITATAASLFVTVSAILNNNLIHPRKQKENGENLQFVRDFNTFRMEDLKLRFAIICYLYYYCVVELISTQITLYMCKYSIQNSLGLAFLLRLGLTLEAGPPVLMYSKLMLLISTIVTWGSCAARQVDCKLGEEVLQMFLKLTLPIRKIPNV